MGNTRILVGDYNPANMGLIQRRRGNASASRDRCPPGHKVSPDRLKNVPGPDVSDHNWRPQPGDENTCCDFNFGTAHNDRRCLDRLGSDKRSSGRAAGWL